MIRKAYGKIVTAAALWGCIGMFLKLLTAAGLSSMEGVAVRSLAACLLYGGFLLVTDPKALRIHPKDWYYFFGTGVCSLLFFNWCYFNAISRSSMSVAAVLLYTAPVFVTLMSALFFHEAITPVKLIALAVTFAGCALVTGLFPLGQQAISPLTILFGLASATPSTPSSASSPCKSTPRPPSAFTPSSSVPCSPFPSPDCTGTWPVLAAGRPGQEPWVLGYYAAPCPMFCTPTVCVLPSRAGPPFLPP